MNRCLTAVFVFGVFMYFREANGQIFCKDDSITITSCDGTYKSGNNIYVNLNRPCTCTVNPLFSGELLVTAYKYSSYQCRTEVIVSSGTTRADFNCYGQYPSSIKFDVTTDETVVNVKTNTSGNFSFCLGINRNGGLGGNVSVVCGNSTTTTKSTPAATTSPSKPETSSSTSTYDNTTVVSQKSTYTSSDNMIHITAGAAGGALVLVVVVIVLVAIIVLRKKKRRNNDQTQKTDEASEHTNMAFDENNYGLPDNPLYHSAQPFDEVGYSSVQKNQLGLPPTEASGEKKNDPFYDVPTNNKPIKDLGTSLMPIYAVPNKSGTSPPEENEQQAIYAQVLKPSKSTAPVPMQTINQDGLVYLEVEKDAPSTNENSPYTKNEIEDGVSYAEINRN